MSLGTAVFLSRRCQNARTSRIHGRAHGFHLAQAATSWGAGASGLLHWRLRMDLRTFESQRQDMGLGHSGSSRHDPHRRRHLAFSSRRETGQGSCHMKADACRAVWLMVMEAPPAARGDCHQLLHHVAGVRAQGRWRGWETRLRWSHASSLKRLAKHRTKPRMKPLQLLFRMRMTLAKKRWDEWD